MISSDNHQIEQKSTAFVALVLFSLFLVLFQVWLCFGVVENVIASKPAMSVPAAAASLVCFGVNVWMYLGIARIEHQL